MAKGQLGLELFPAELDNQEFRAAWAEWLADRKDRRLPRYTARAEGMQLKRLAEMGSGAAIDAIQWSITQGYKGIWPAPAAQPAAAAAAPSVWEIKQKLDATEERIRQLQSRSPGVHCNLRDFLTAAELDELSALISNRKSLKQHLTQ